MWLNALKIALIEKDIEKLEELSNAKLEFTTLEEMQEALYLIQEAEQLLTTLKNRTALSMQQLKKNIDFLKATQSQEYNKLDLIS